MGKIGKFYKEKISKPINKSYNSARTAVSIKSKAKAKPNRRLIEDVFK